MGDSITNFEDRAARPTDPSDVRAKSIQLHDIKIGLRASPFVAVLKFVVSGALAGAVTAIATLVLDPIAEWFQSDADWDWNMLVRAMHFKMERIAGEAVGLTASGAIGGAMGGLLTAIVAAYWKRAETPAGAVLVWASVFIVVVLSISLLTGSTHKLVDSKMLPHLGSELVGVAIYGATLGIFIQGMNRLLGPGSAAGASKL